MIASGRIHTLVGFENNRKDGKSNCFNFNLDNGTRSTQRDEHNPTNYTLMIPADALNKIRSVTICDYDDWIGGFCFFDKDGALLW